MTLKNNWRYPIHGFGERAYSDSSQTERILFFFIAGVCLISGLLLLWRLNDSFLIEVPERGGTISEGIIGIPRFINPALEASDADKDMTALVYAGLLRATPEGDLVVDAAKEYSVSPDGRTYHFVLKDNLVFHDGTPLTADDVEFTIQKIQDPSIKSPKRGTWNDVVVEKINSKEIKFTIRQPFSPFIYNTTVGILPKHIWKEVPTDEFSFSQFNINPVGSGPYKIKNIKRNSIGLPIYHQLVSFENYSLGEPFVDRFFANFYQNEKELLVGYKRGEIDSLGGISPKYARDIENSSKLVLSTLPRTFGIFFNQNQAAVFVNKEVRQALALAIEKDLIINEVLYGFGKKIDGPLLRVAESDENEATTTPTDRAIALLTKNGWSINESTGVMEKKNKTSTTILKFSIETSDAPELKQTAEIIKDSWKKIGADVDVKIFEISDLNQNIIRPRKYDALLFGEVIGSDKDFYPFWHSSQRIDPGLNIALYTNIKTDKLLEEIRVALDKKVREEKLDEFEKIVKEDSPVAFIYAPEFIYIVPKTVKNVRLGEISNSGERFLNVHEWYIDTNKVWKIFTQ